MSTQPLRRPDASDVFVLEEDLVVPGGGRIAEQSGVAAAGAALVGGRVEV